MLKPNFKHKIVVKRAKRQWRREMIASYPEFEKRKWAGTTYRLAHPQH